MPGTSTSAGRVPGLGVHGSPGSGPCSSHSIAGVAALPMHEHSAAPFVSHLGHRAWAHPGLLSQSEMPRRDMDTCAHGTAADTLSHTPWHGQAQAQPGVSVQHRGRCRGSTARPRRGSGKPAPARTAHAAHTYTNSSFPLSQQPEVQTNSHTHTPASPPDSHSLLSVPRGDGLCTEHPSVPAPSVCLDFPKRWAVLG